MMLACLTCSRRRGINGSSLLLVAQFVPNLANTLSLHSETPAGVVELGLFETRLTVVARITILSPATSPGRSRDERVAR